MSAPKKRLGWTFEEIVDANPREPGQARSRLDHLRSIGAVSETSFCTLSDVLEERGVAFVGALFQLPFEVQIDSGWVPIPTTPDSIFAEVKFTPAVLMLNEAGTFDLLDRNDACERGWGITQGCAIFKVWGKRQQPHVRFRNTIDYHDRWNHVVVPQGESWIDNRPMTVRDYELNFARRLRIEVSAMLRGFMPAFTLASRSETPIPRWTYGFIPMLSPGRITHTSTVPVASYLFDRPLSPLPSSVPAERLREALANPRREFGQFEHQLFALERLRREGEIALAVIGTAALIEWLLKTRTSDTRRGARLVDLLAQQKTKGLPADLVRLADEAREARNRFVHGAPPERRSIKSDDPGVRPGSALPGPVTPERAREYIEAAFELFRQLNLSKHSP